jgi:CheY-like chemotaxis protein
MHPLPKKSRWLVVDDDPAALDYTCEVLHSIPSAEVIALQDSRAALDIFFAEPESFELVITDYQMPHVNGLELARSVRHRSPETKVLLVTGAAGEVLEWRDLNALLAKPFTRQALISAVAAALSKTGFCLV